jgi:hypothetical protein
MEKFLQLPDESFYKLVGTAKDWFQETQLFIL